MSHALPRATRRYGDYQHLYTRRHAPTKTPHALSRARRAKRWHVPPVHDVMDDVIIHYPVWLGWPGLNRTDLETWPGPNRLKKKKREKKKKCFDQVDPWPWPKSQNFQNGPVPLNFSSTFRFWDPFLHLKLRNCANVQFPKVDFCTNVDQKVKIFKRAYLT